MTRTPCLYGPATFLSQVIELRECACSLPDSEAVLVDGESVASVRSPSLDFPASFCPAPLPPPRFRPSRTRPPRFLAPSAGESGPRPTLRSKSRCLYVGIPYCILPPTNRRGLDRRYVAVVPDAAMFPTRLYLIPGSLRGRANWSPTLLTVCCIVIQNGRVMFFRFASESRITAIKTCPAAMIRVFAGACIDSDFRAFPKLQSSITTSYTR